jgi:hypothetical protein
MNENDPFNCSCRKCVAALRYSRPDDLSSDDELENVNCEFAPLFEAKLGEFGMTFAVVPMDMRISRPHHECAAGLRYGRETVDMDVHIAVHGCDPRRGDSPDWMNFTYGAKLFKATTVNDQELKKLEALFVWLLSVHSSDIRQILMDGLGYY